MDFLAYLGLTSAPAGRKGDVFEVNFPEKRPLGLKVAIRAFGDETTADADTAIVVVALPRHPERSDEPGTVEATGMVKIGDELVSGLPPILKGFEPLTHAAFVFLGFVQSTPQPL